MKTTKVIFWICTILLFVFEGLMPLAALVVEPTTAIAGTVYLQYPTYFAYVIIAFKGVGSVVLLIPRLPRQIKEWTYAGFGFNFICASISQIIVDGLTYTAFLPLIFLSVTISSYVTFFRSYPAMSSPKQVAFI